MNPEEFDDDGDDDSVCCDECGSDIDGCDVHFETCSQCGCQGCSECLHDGGDDIYPVLCDECDP